jgi:hypothetical protein
VLSDLSKLWVIHFFRRIKRIFRQQHQKLQNMLAAPLAAQPLGFFLVDSLGVMILSIFDLHNGRCLGEHGPLTIYCWNRGFFFGGEKKIIKSGVGREKQN